MIPLTAVLAEQGLDLKEVHLPRPEAPVRWVATSELVDPTPFLEGGELLLTTGLATAGWRREWTGYVTRLREAGVAGLGIGTGLTHRTPPRGLVRACEELGVNLLEVPRLTAFVAISRRTAGLLEQAEERAARTALDLQRRLTAAAAGPDPSSAILRQLAKSTTGVACLFTPAGQLLAGSPGDLHLTEIREQLKAIRSRGMLAALTLSTPGQMVIIQPIGLNQRPDSYLVTATPTRPTEPQRRAVATAAALLALVSEQQHQQLEDRRRVAIRAFDLLLAGDHRTAQLLLDRNAFPTHLQLLAARGPAEAIEDALTLAEAESADGGAGPRADGGAGACGTLAVRLGGDLFVVASASAAGRIASELAELGLFVGVGGVAAPGEIAGSRSTAVQALARASDARPVVRWDRIVDEGLSALVDRTTAAAFAASYLGSLTAGQLETLRSYLRHHGSHLKTADELGLHRNTVRNRLAQIEHQLGDSLDDPDVRMTAWFALQLPHL
ncbi:PucR family transcriptional regulator [Kribbella sp. NPDC051718]|uniref:PucR family transcriptional regulator n=1 Tax=Kribbella sp. NPDC051718 TaxID=3155168 RepID=UPI0034445DFD